MKNKLLFMIIFGGVFVFTAAAESVNAQDLGVRIPIRNVVQTTRTSTGRTSTGRTTNRPATIQRVIVPVREVVTKRMMVKTSNLTVSSESGAKVLLESALRGVNAMTKEVAKENPDDKTVEFENLRPGKYTVSVSLEGFQPQEAEVDVPAEKTVGISIDLIPIKYQLNLETNVAEGEVRYAKAKLLRTNPDGSIETTEPGGYCIAPIKKGKAMISEMQKGYYNIDIRPAAVEYDPLLTAINVPTEISNNADDDSTEVSYSIKLEPKISRETFASAWINDDWNNLPANWKLNGKMMTMNSAGIVLPRNPQYRYYTDFELVSDVVSLDGKTIGFAFRAVNPENYYLFQISGAKAAEPFVAKGYVIKDGKPEAPFSPVPINHFAKTIAEGKYFRIRIKGEGNVFKISIEDSQTADTLPVGEIIDRDNNFRKGAVGIVGREGSNFEVGTFTVCAKSCR